jgi:hypothetical protein
MRSPTSKPIAATGRRRTIDNSGAGLGRLAKRKRNRGKPPASLNGRLTLDDFFAYMPQHNYIFAPTGELWPGESVNARVPLVVVGTDENGKPIAIAASIWLDRNKPVEQMTWAPGEPMLIRGRLITGGGWIDRPGASVFNLYRPPTLPLGDPNEAGPWLDHVRKVYPDDADPIIKYLAHRKQRPHEKISHALVLGGPQGIGKDSLLEPVVRAIGPWNFAEVSPQQLLGRFNGFLKSVMLRVSEARDLGEVNRYSFYDHLKAMTATPPDVLRVDEKHLREYYVLNICGVVITTNHKTDGVFLPADDRRHYVAWSELTSADFESGYWIKLWRWYDEGGDRHVAAYLDSLDLSDFDLKAPPLKTKAFWDIVDAGRAGEDAERADVIDALGVKDKEGAPVSPVAFTLAAVQGKAEALTPSKKKKDGEPIRGTFAYWLGDRRNRRSIPHRFEQCGFSPVRNDDAKDGLWKINGARQVVYARSNLSVRDRLAAANLVRDRGTVLELAELAGGADGGSEVGEVSDLVLSSPAHAAADALCEQFQKDSSWGDNSKTTDYTDSTDRITDRPPANPLNSREGGSGAAPAPRSVKIQKPPPKPPRAPEDVVASARGAGARFCPSEDWTVFSLDWPAGRDPVIGKIVDDELRANHDAVLAFLRLEAGLDPYPDEPAQGDSGAGAAP